MGKWAPPTPSLLALRILLPNVLNSGELVCPVSLCHISRPPDPGSGETPAWGFCLLCLPAPFPHSVRTPLCVTAFQPLIKCLLYSAWAWSVCGGEWEAGGGKPQLQPP